jgi:hypothetical protein
MSISTPALLLLAFGIFTQTHVERQTDRSTAESVNAWWFPTSTPEGTEMHYHAVYTETTSAPRIGKSTRKLESDFVMRAKLACEDVVRFIYVPPPSELERPANDLTFWGQLLSNLQGEGFEVTADEVRMSGGPLLRGPWRSGDRLTLAWATVFLGASGCIIHAEVMEAAPSQIRLTCDIWGGPFLPEWKGEGTILATSDELGISAVTANWDWTFGGGKFEASLVVSRTKMSQSEAGAGHATPNSQGAGHAPQSAPVGGVQVNVDGNGRNIVGDAASQPSLVVDPRDPKHILVAWQQFDSVNSNFTQAAWSESRDGGRTWKALEYLERATYRRNPILAPSPDGTLYWATTTGGLTAGVFASTDAGMTWEAREDFVRGWDYDVAVDCTDGSGRGHLYVVGTRGPGTSTGLAFARSMDNARSFGEPIMVDPNADHAAITVGPNGTVYIAFTDGASIYLTRSRNAMDHDAEPVFESPVSVDLGGRVTRGAGPNPGGALGDLQIAANHAHRAQKGELYLFCSVDPPGPDPLDVMFVRSADDGMTWSTPCRVNDDEPDSGAWQWLGMMSVAPNGRIDAVWNDTRYDSDGRLSALVYSCSKDGGVTWSKNSALDAPWDPHVGYAQAPTVGNRNDMVSDNEGANIAYTATFDGEQDVYFLRVQTEDFSPR